MLKKIITALTPVLVMLFLFGNQAFGAENSPESSELTKEEFEEQFLENIDESTGTEKESLELEYSKYTELDVEDQNKLIEYLNDEELMKNIAEQFSSPSSSELTLQTTEDSVERENTVINKINDDIVIVDELKDGPTPIKPGEMSIMAVQTKTASNSRWAKVAGVTVMELRSEVTYKRNSSTGKITGLVGSDHRVTRNLTLNRFNLSGKTHGSSSTKAWAKTNFTIDMAIKGLWTYRSGYSEVAVTNNGKITGGVYYN